MVKKKGQTTDALAAAFAALDVASMPPAPPPTATPASQFSGSDIATPPSTISFADLNMTFFSSFDDFMVDTSKSEEINFGLLGLKRGWRLNSKAWRRNWRACFGYEYGPELNPYADSFFEFFACFPGFEANPTAPLEIEFARLSDFMGWNANSYAWRVYRNQAYQTDFVRAYGGDAALSKLESWQALCSEVSIEPIPQSITQCRKALARVNVNICDLLDCRRTGGKVHLFRTKWQLIRYTHLKKRMFPKEAAKEDGFLRALLKNIF